MGVSLDGKLVVAISSRALFDFEEENQVFEQGDDRAYMNLQLDRLETPAKPGVAFSLVQKLLAFNTSEAQRVEVVILSRNDPVSGMRVFRSAQHYGLPIQRGSFTRGQSPWRYLKPLNANLFLSTHLSDVRAALDAGVPAAQVYPHSAHASEAHPHEVRIAFDGDADRCFLVDEKGDLVNPSALTALIASRELKRYPASNIIYNLISSRAVKEVVEENGGSAIRSRVGHSYIKKLMAETDAVFGGEHSGHFYFRDFWKADSGMLAALHAIAALGETDTSLSKLLSSFNRYHSSGEINSTIPDAKAAMELIEKIYSKKDGVEVDHLDGLTINGDTWWFNLRASNTEPLLRLNVEASTEARMKKVRDDVLNTIRGDLDILVLIP